MKKYYMPREDGQLVDWLNNFSSKIGSYATKYNLTAAQVTFVQNAAAYFIFWYNALTQLNAAVQKVTAYKNEIRDGVKAGGSPSLVPGDIVFGTPPAAVPPGVLPTLRSIVGTIKKHQSYTTADGEDLKIEGDEQVIDPLTLKPEFKIVIQAGHPRLVWKKGISDGVKIKRAVFDNPQNPNPNPGGDLPFQFLAIDTQPDYIDTSPLPAFGQSITVAYVMIYILNDEEIGQWSDIKTITISGTP